MILVLDDLHWADKASLSLLAYLVRDYNLSDFVAVATARPTDLNEQARGLLAQLGREVDAVRLQLDPLPSPDLSQLIADLVGSVPPQSLVTSVESATDGNPFFAEELTVHLLDTEFVVDQVSGQVRPSDSAATSVPPRILRHGGQPIALIAARLPGAARCRGRDRSRVSAVSCCLCAQSFGARGG